jgi:predicted 2-oxoglutarate/Fe(II)-dependent dioxygenase YbiX
MDHAAAEPAEILAQDISLDTDARRVLTVDVDAGTLAFVAQALDAEREVLRSVFEMPLGEREGAGFLRYHAGGFYGPHRDRGDSPAWPDANRRLIAAVVFLNDEFSGGALRIHGEDGARDITPRQGSLVAFPADTLHEVLAVTDGTRDTIVDWFYEATN